MVNCPTPILRVQLHHLSSASLAWKIKIVFGLAWHVRCRIFRRSYFPGRVSHLFLVSCTCPIPPLFFPLPPLPFRWRLKYFLLLRLRENGRRSFFRYAIPCVFVSSVLSTDKHFTVGSMGKIWPSQQVGESARKSNLTLPKAQEKSSQIMLAQKKSSFGQFCFSSPFPFLHSTDEILDLDFSPSFSVLLVI